jgi:hypothetical protein
MMFLVSDAKGDRRLITPREDRGVLANLPRTRPQRSSPRRAAARKTATRTGPARSATTTTPRAAAPRRARSTARRPRDSTPRPDTVPRQGFESDGETMSGSVQPPGSAEFAASAVELLGELAKAGLSTGERLLKDVLSRLPHS